MPTNIFYPIAAIAVAAACTFLTRVLPFILFGGKKDVPSYVQYLGKFLPPAIIATLIVYCLKDIHPTLPPSGFAEFICIALVIVLHLWKRNNLLSIGAGTVCYMLLTQYVFI